MEQRLDKWIASHTAHSRKEAKALIHRGMVTIDGRAARSGEEKIPAGAVISVEGIPILLQEHSYIMMNKPEGVLSATRDKRAVTVLDLVPPHLMRTGLFPAGRLDKNTTGFLLLTDDGAFAHELLAPKKHVPKTYHARLARGTDWELLAAAFAEGITIGEGEETSPAQLLVLEDSEYPLVELVIYEGMFHQVKRMFAASQLLVTALKRVKIGSLPLDPGLGAGECRQMTEAEIASIW